MFEGMHDPQDQSEALYLHLAEQMCCFVCGDCFATCLSLFCSPADCCLSKCGFETPICMRVPPVSVPLIFKFLTPSLLLHTPIVTMPSHSFSANLILASR